MEKDLMSQAEWQVMRVLWANPDVTSAEVIQFLSQAFDWQAATVKTLLGRLKQKGLVTAEKVSGKYRYRAVIDEREQLTHQLNLIKASLCQTKQVTLLELLLEHGTFSQDDLARVSQLAHDKQKQAPKVVVCDCLPGQCTCQQGHSDCCMTQDDVCGCLKEEGGCREGSASYFLECRCQLGNICICSSEACHCGLDCACGHTDSVSCTPACTCQEGGACSCSSEICACGLDCTCLSR